MTKPIPKSLHTVTVLKAIATAKQHETGLPAHACVLLALDFLGLAYSPDTHDLIAATVRQMDKGAKK